MRQDVLEVRLRSLDAKLVDHREARAEQVVGTNQQRSSGC